MHSYNAQMIPRGSADDGKHIAVLFQYAVAQGVSVRSKRDATEKLEGKVQGGVWA